MPHVSFLFWMEYLLWRCGCGGVVAGLKQGGIHCFIWETICINAVKFAYRFSYNGADNPYCICCIQASGWVVWFMILISAFFIMEK